MNSIDSSNNAKRADRAQEALKQYVEAKGEKFYATTAAIADLIADLLHLAERLHDQDDPVGSVLRLAHLHYDAEAGDPEGYLSAREKLIPYEAGYQIIEYRSTVIWARSEAEAITKAQAIDFNEPELFEITTGVPECWTAQVAEP